MSTITLNNTQIVVLGIHRCGSSATAGALHRLGVNMGLRGMLGGHRTNPGGHYEDLEFLHLNDRVVLDWKQPTVLEKIPPTWLKFYRDLITERDAKLPYWGVKDPRLVVTLKYFYPYLTNPKIIHVTRLFSSSVKSLAKRENISFSEAEKIQLIYQNSLEETLTLVNEKQIPVLRVDFEMLVKIPQTVVEGIVEFLAPMQVLPVDIESACKWVDSKFLTVKESSDE